MKLETKLFFTFTFLSLRKFVTLQCNLKYNVSFMNEIIFYYESDNISLYSISDYVPEVINKRNIDFRFSSTLFVHTSWLDDCFVSLCLNEVYFQLSNDNIILGIELALAKTSFTFKLKVFVNRIFNCFKLWIWYMLPKKS